ncbi:MAG: HAD-IA family hydrolase [Acidobacteria bacterium]|nr:HAD-IA family hydrolase [Acidobacteriota bacterium]
MIRFLIFDLDGTLVDSYEAITESLNYALVRLGRQPRSAREVRSRVGHGLESLLREMAGEDCVEAGVRLFRRHYARVCTEKTRLLPGVQPTLKGLHRRGFRMAVATNKPVGFTERILSALGVRDCFEFLIGADQVTHPKPHPEMIFRVLRHFGCSRWEAAFVGDMVVDVETGRSAGVPVIVLPTGSQTRRQLERASPDLILGEFPELPVALPQIQFSRNASRAAPMVPGGTPP